MDIANKLTAADKALVAKIHGVSVDYIYKVLSNNRAKKNRTEILKSCKKVILSRENAERKIFEIRQSELARMMNSLSTEHNPQ